MRLPYLSSLSNSNILGFDCYKINNINIISLNRNNMPHGFYPMQINCIKTELSLLNILYNKKNNINEYAWVEILNNLFVNKLKVQFRIESLMKSYA